MMENLDDGKWNDEELRRILEERVDDDESWAQPGGHVWDGVSQTLHQRGRKRRGFAWWSAAGSVALLLILAWILSRQEEQVEPRLYPVGRPERMIPTVLPATDAGIVVGTREKKATALQDQRPYMPLVPEVVEPVPYPDRRPSTVPTIIPGGAAGQSGDTISQFPFIPTGIPDTMAAAHSGASPFEIDADRTIDVIASLASRREAASLKLNTSNPPMNAVIVAIPQRRGTQRLSIYGHGTRAGMDWQQLRRGGPGPPPIQEEPVDQRFEALRFGSGWEWQFASGWFLGTGLEFQSVREETVRALPWRFTRKGGMPSPGGFNQQLALALPGGFGTSSAELRVGVRELQNTQDYQEGDSVRLSLTLRQQIRQVRLPVLAGYRIGHGRFFGEIRAGVGVRFHTGFDAALTRLVDERNRLVLQGHLPLKRSPQMKRTSLDVQAGAAVGMHLVEGLECSIGWDGWRGVGPSVEHPAAKGFLLGSGITAGLRWQLRGS